MANFTDEEAMERIKNPLNTSSISLARVQEERLLFHSEPILEKYNLPFYAYRNFTLWWQALVTKEKYNKIESLITTPLCSISVVEEIHRQISKFNDAQDRYVSFEFTSKDFTNDYEAYLQQINDDSFWRQDCCDALKAGICDYVVIDCPSKQKGKRPEPYQFFVSPSMLNDVQLNKFTGKVEYINFNQNDVKWDSALNTSTFSLQRDCIAKKLVFIDDTYYRVLIKEDRNDADWKIYSKVAHNLDYCPAIDFWQPSIQGTNGINKKGILTNILSKLDKYLFYMALVDYMDVYGAFPIFVTYAMDEEQFDSKRKEVNFNDYYSPSTTSYVSNNDASAQNPRTSVRWMGAPGSIIEYAQPADSNDVNLVKDAPRFINMDVDSLKHVNDRGKTLRLELIEYVTGEDREFMNEISKNPEMFDASYTKQDSIITFVKRQIERVHRFVTKARAELRYGKQYFVSCTVNYGTEYFLKNASAIVGEYQKAVEAGMPPEYCNQIAIEGTNTRFKNNIDVLSRQRIMQDIIPYQSMTLEDLVSSGVNVSDVDNYVIRINSVMFVRQFELDYGDIVKFGTTLEYSDKIFFIKTKIKDYARSINWKSVSIAGEYTGTAADS